MNQLVPENFLSIEAIKNMEIEHVGDKNFMKTEHVGDRTSWK